MRLVGLLFVWMCWLWDHDWIQLRTYAFKRGSGAQLKWVCVTCSKTVYKRPKGWEGSLSP